MTILYAEPSIPVLAVLWWDSAAGEPNIVALVDIRALMAVVRTMAALWVISLAKSKLDQAMTAPGLTAQTRPLLMLHNLPMDTCLCRGSLGVSFSPIYSLPIFDLKK